MSHIDNVVTRFPNKVNNHGDADLFQGLPVMDQRLAHEFFDDFDAYIASSDSWVENGGVGLVFVADSADGGVLRMTAADGDTAQIQRGFGNFTLELGKRLWYSARVAFQDPTNNSGSVTLSEVNTSIASGITDGFQIQVANAGTALAYTYESTSGTVLITNTVNITLTADVFIDIEVFWDGVDQLVFSVDGVFQSSITVTTLTAVVLAPAVVSTSASGTEYVDVDYAMVVKER